MRTRKLSSLSNATDASLVVISIYKVSSVTRGFIKGGGWPHPLSFLKVSGVPKGREENRNPLSPLWPLGTFLPRESTAPGRGLGGNWMTIYLGRKYLSILFSEIHCFKNSGFTTHADLSPNFPPQALPGGPTFCRTESRQRFAQEAFPLLGISPSG